MYLIADLQNKGRYFADAETYKTKQEVVDQLADYHDIDFTGCVDENGEDIEVSIYEFLKQFKTVQAKLNYLLDYGQWELEKVKS